MHAYSVQTDSFTRDIINLLLKEAAIRYNAYLSSTTELENTLHDR